MSVRAPTAIDRQVGDRIGLARRAAGMSQRELGVQAGVAYQQVQKYENGADRIGAGRLFRIALATHQPIAFFFRFGEVRLPHARRPDLLADDGIRRLVAAASRIRSPALMANLAQIAETFAGEGELSPPG